MALVPEGVAVALVPEGVTVAFGLSVVDALVWIETGGFEAVGGFLQRACAAGRTWASWC